MTPAGTVVTREGRTLSGEIRLADGKVQVRAPGLPNGAGEVPLDQVSRLEVAGNGAAPAAPDYAAAYHAANKAKPVTRNVLAEYFADTDLKDRRFARYESQINSYWKTNDLQDPGIPTGGAVRYTTGILPRFSEDYTFGVESHTGFRLWADGKLVLDHWGASKSGAKYFSDPVRLTADRQVDMRLEVRMGKHGTLTRLFWRSPRQPGPFVEAGHYRVARGADRPPEVAVTAPADQTRLLGPKSILLEAAATDPDGRVEKVGYFHGHALIGEATRPPYRVEWKDPPSGYVSIVARATDDKGVSAPSAPVYLAVADRGGGTLPDPWGAINLGEGRNAPEGDGGASFDPAAGTFRLTKGGGQLTENKDECQFVFQPVRGDFQLVARVTALGPPDNIAGPVAGILIKEWLGNNGKCAAALATTQGLAWARRTDGWGRVIAFDRAFPSGLDPKGGPAGCWLKIVRHGKRVRLYASADGQSWGILGADKVDFPEEVLVGLFAQSRDAKKPATATFDHVSLKLGSPPLAFAVPGALFKSGTFLACDVGGLKEGSLIFTRAGKRTTRPASDVARLIYKAVPAELADQTPGDRGGVLLGSGDFIEGEIKDLGYRVTVSNIVFGPRSFAVKSNDVLAVHMAPTALEQQPWTVTAADGSVFQCRTVRFEPDKAVLEDVTLGPVELAGKEVVEIVRNAGK